MNIKNENTIPGMITVEDLFDSSFPVKPIKKIESEKIDTLPPDFEARLRQMPLDPNTVYHPPIDEPKPEHIDLYYKERGPVGVYYPPADYFAKLRVRKIKKEKEEKEITNVVGQ